MFRLQRSPQLINLKLIRNNNSGGLINLPKLLNKSPNSTSISNFSTSPSTNSSTSSPLNSTSIFSQFSTTLSKFNLIKKNENGENLNPNSNQSTDKDEIKTINIEEKKKKKSKEEDEYLEIQKTKTKLKKIQQANKNYLYFPVSQKIDDKFICPFKEEEKISLIESYNLFLNPSTKFEYKVSSELISDFISSKASSTVTTSASSTVTSTKNNNTSTPSSKIVDTASLVPIVEIDEDVFFNSNGTHLTWLGHDSVLYSIEGTRILINPFFNNKIKKNFFSFYNKLDKIQHGTPATSSNLFSPSNIMKSNKFNFFNKNNKYTPTIETISPDIILITSNNYTNYCQNTINYIGNLALWIVPLGMKDYLRSQYNITNVIELDWWENFSYIRKDGELINFVFLPTIYEDKRYLMNSINKKHFLKYMVKNSSLIGSYLINYHKKKTYYSNITGFNKDFFSNLRHLYGSFDLSILPIGSYKPQKILKNIQVNPENSWKISKELESKESIGISWGTYESFDLNPLEPALELGRIREKNCAEIKEFYTIPINKTIQFDTASSNSSTSPIKKKVKDNYKNDFVYNHSEIFHSYLDHLRQF